MKAVDDYQAVKAVVETIEPFNSEDRERILRWAREKLGMLPAPLGADVDRRPPDGAGSTVPPTGHDSHRPNTPQHAADIKTFVAQKAPGSDSHFAAAVAFYHQFVAPEPARKSSIGKDDIIEACRNADRKRPASPAQVLVNAYHEGILDRSEKGQYRLNAVGENLVAMVLPGDGEKVRSKKRTRAKTRVSVNPPKAARKGRKKSRR